MLTRVILDGPLGKRFGREWHLAVCTPNQAINMIEANSPGVLSWIRLNMRKYANYRVTLTGKDGKKLKLDNDTYAIQNEAPAEIRFTPVTEGASAAARIVVGAILIVVGVLIPPLGAYTIPMGIGLMIGGLVELLSPQPKTSDGAAREDKTSYYFNGPVNTTTQGVPVPLVYGRCLVGSQSVSAAITIDQLM